MLEARKKLRPLVVPVLEGKGVACDPEELVRYTAEALVKSHAPPGVKDNELRLVCKHCGDGAGSQQVWKSRSSK